MTDQALEPRWLDEGELDTWIRFLAVSFLLPAALEHRMQRANGMSMFEYLVLAMLLGGAGPDPAAQGPRQGGQRLVVAPLACAQTSRGSRWVRRSPKPGDGRVTVATLTDAGYAALAAAAPRTSRTSAVSSSTSCRRNRSTSSGPSASGWSCRSPRTLTALERAAPVLCRGGFGTSPGAHERGCPDDSAGRIPRRGSDRPGCFEPSGGGGGI